MTGFGVCVHPIAYAHRALHRRDNALFVFRARNSSRLRHLVIFISDFSSLLNSFVLKFYFEKGREGGREGERARHTRLSNGSAIIVSAGQPPPRRRIGP